jgi:hypothetical protein
MITLDANIEEDHSSFLSLRLVLIEDGTVDRTNVERICEEVARLLRTLRARIVDKAYSSGRGLDQSRGQS